MKTCSRKCHRPLAGPGSLSWFAIAAVLVLGWGPQSSAEETASPAVFDAQVAPLLARRCLGCHNASEKKGGLDLSGEAAARAGGDSGAVIESGEAENSVLWQRIAADEMPPDDPLPPEEKERLRQWIAAGATWGSGDIDPYAFSSESRAGYDWWSLQPVDAPAPPEVAEPSWPKNKIDNFILARLEAAGLQPAPEADPRTLVRRVYFDLIGLPPTPQEMDAWSNRLTLGPSVDNAEIDDAAYGQLVDSLLASPHYGERWARHWMDVIRFGETQGFERNLIRENAWRYRDWIIAAFNDDLPYDEFIRQQIAGDVLYPDDLDALLATGYHVCGTWDQVGYLEGSAAMQKVVRQDGLEDLVSTLGQAFLGLTIHCARCHDHKFDPISQREYYQVAALLGGAQQEAKERQGITAKPKTSEYNQWSAAVNETRIKLGELEHSIRDKYSSTDGQGIEGLQVLYRPNEAKSDAKSDSKDDSKILQDGSQVGSPLNLVVEEPSRFASTDPATKLIQAAKASGELTIEAWITPANVPQTGPARIVTLSRDSGQRNFTLGQDGSSFEVRLRTTATDQNGMPALRSPKLATAEERQHVVFTFNSSGVGRLFVNGKPVAQKETGGDLSNWNDDFRLGLGDELSGDRPWDGRFHFVAIYSSALTAKQIKQNFESESRDVRAGESFQTLLAKASEEERTRYRALEQKLGQLQQSDPTRGFEGVAHVIIPKQPPVFHRLERGNVNEPLEVVSPAGLQALSVAGLSPDFGLAPDAPEAERRVKLAEWLSDSRNPLTPRVWVNRLWHYHFGQGIVDTPSDFGFAGGRPTHPVLLDFLAAQLVESGWKTKEMHRTIVTSATYRQASNVTNARAEAVDAENRLWWRSNPRRLEGEAVRDAVLAISGSLNPQLGGPSYHDMQVNGGAMGTNAEFTTPVDEFNDQLNRRTIYRLWARSGSNPLLESLDCPDPSVMAPRRSQTITPIQSLALMNNRLMEQAAENLAKRIATAASDDDLEHQIKSAYAAVLCRQPSARELERCREFVDRRGLEQLCLVLFNTNEFLSVE